MIVRMYLNLGAGIQERGIFLYHHERAWLPGEFWGHFVGVFDNRDDRD